MYKESITFKKYDKYNNYIKNHPSNIIILLIYSKVCHYNEEFSKKYNDLYNKYYNYSVKFLKIEYENNKKIAKDHFLTGIPCFIIFKKRNPIKIINGNDFTLLEKYITEYLNINITL